MLSVSYKNMPRSRAGFQESARGFLARSGSGSLMIGGIRVIPCSDGFGHPDTMAALSPALEHLAAAHNPARNDVFFPQLVMLAELGPGGRYYVVLNLWTPDRNGRMVGDYDGTYSMLIDNDRASFCTACEQTGGR